MPLRTLLLVFLAAAIATGCGRRGPLERPDVTPDPAAPELQASELQTDESALRGTLDTTSPGAQQPAADRPAEAPARRFILDPLI